MDVVLDCWIPMNNELWVMHYISVICGQWSICFSSQVNGVYLHYQLWFQLVVSLYINKDENCHFLIITLVENIDFTIKTDFKQYRVCS